MQKNFIICFLFICSIFYAQSTVVAAKTKEKTTKQTLHIDADSLTKVSFDENFKSKYKDDTFIYDIKKAEKNWIEQFTEWILKKLSTYFDVKATENVLGIIDITVKIIAVLIVIFVIYLIVNRLLNKEGNWIFASNTDKKLIRYDDIEEHLTETDFEILIAKTLKNKQQRLAIRYYYLWLLKIMWEREMIIWDIEKTNQDYANELQNQSFKEDFTYLSYLYNHIWYGEFDMNISTFEKSKTAFELAIKKLKS